MSESIVNCSVFTTVPSVEKLPLLEDSKKWSSCSMEQEEKYPYSRSKSVYVMYFVYLMILAGFFM